MLILMRVLLALALIPVAVAVALRQSENGGSVAAMLYAAVPIAAAILILWDGAKHKMEGWRE